MRLRSKGKYYIALEPHSQKANGRYCSDEEEAKRVCGYASDDKAEGCRTEVRCASIGTKLEHFAGQHTKKEPGLRAGRCKAGTASQPACASGLKERVVIPFTPGVESDVRRVNNSKQEGSPKGGEMRAGRRATTTKRRQHAASHRLRLRTSHRRTVSTRSRGVRGREVRTAPVSRVPAR